MNPRLPDSFWHLVPRQLVPRQLVPQRLFTRRWRLGRWVALAIGGLMMAVLIQACTVAPEETTAAEADRPEAVTSDAASSDRPPPSASAPSPSSHWTQAELIPVTTAQRSYHIGNSLTDTISDWLTPIAQSAGYNHEYFRSTIPGAPTDWIWTHPNEALGEPDYRTVFETKAPLDHLVIQPFAGHDRSIDNEADFGGRFYQLARENSPEVQLWVYAQWPDQGVTDNWSMATGSVAELGLPPATDWETAVLNHLAYHEAVRQKLDDQNQGQSVRLIPGGLGLRQLKRAIDSGTVPDSGDFFAEHFADDIHLKAKGAYFIALVHYACLYGQSPEGLTFENTGLTAAQAAIYQRIAWETVQTYQSAGAAAL